jgi:hypothetical protein
MENKIKTINTKEDEKPKEEKRREIQKIAFYEYVISILALLSKIISPLNTNGKANASVV